MTSVRSLGIAASLFLIIASIVGAIMGSFVIISLPAIILFYYAFKDLASRYNDKNILEAFKKNIIYALIASLVLEELMWGLVSMLLFVGISISYWALAVVGASYFILVAYFLVKAYGIPAEILYERTNISGFRYVVTALYIYYFLAIASAVIIILITLIYSSILKYAFNILSIVNAIVFMVASIFYMIAFLGFNFEQTRPRNVFYRM